MGVVVGLVLGAGLTLVWSAFWEPQVSSRRTDRIAARRELLVQAGFEDAPPWAPTALGAGLAVVVGTMALAATGAPTIAGAFALLAAFGPQQVVASRARRRRRRFRDLWPDAVDHLASGVRAGLSLPEALGQLGERGPVELRAPFHRFADDYRISGRFTECLDALKDRLADPVADRIVESLRITRDVGGADLGRLLRTLSAFLREDITTRAELEARQSWTVTGARIAVAGPWVVLALLATRPETAAAYSTPAGAAVLAVGASCSLVAYRVMTRVGRLPEDRRVLR